MSVVLSVVGGVVGAIGAIRQGNAEGAAADFNAEVQERNAIIAEQNRQLTVRQSTIDAEDRRLANRRVMASIKAAYGSSGLELSGSQLDVLEDTATEQELDVQRIEFEGRVRSREGSLEVLGLKEGAGLSRARASGARSAGKLKALGSVIGGLGDAASTLARTA